MNRRFDPSTFIVAEQQSRTAVATPCDVPCDTIAAAEMAAFRHSGPPAEAGVAEVAAVAAPPGPQDVTTPWAAGVRRLFELPTPARRSAAEWARLLDDAETFLRDWGSIAVGLGWSTTDVFGSPADPFVGRLDQIGLVPLLRGRPVVAMTAETAVIANTRGDPNTFRLYPWRRQDGVPIWQAYDAGSGP